MKIAIIDNEENIRFALKKLLEQVLTKEDEIVEAEGVVSGLKLIQQEQPQIVFLDIEMNDGTGFDLLNKLHQINFQLIITTAHNKYAIEAFKVSAIDYLLKPIELEPLLTSLNKAKQQLNQANLQMQLQILMQQMANHPNLEKRIVLKDIDTTYFIHVADISFCEAEGTYTRFHFSNANPILVSKNLKEYENILEPMGFLRTHHSYLVNPSKVKMYDKRNTGNLILHNDKQIPISQRKKEFVVKRLEQYLSETSIIK